MYVFDVFVWGQQQLQSLGWLASSTTPETAKPVITPMSEEMAKMGWGVKKDIIFVLQLMSFGVCHGCLWHLCFITSVHFTARQDVAPAAAPDDAKAFQITTVQTWVLVNFVSQVEASPSSSVIPTASCQIELWAFLSSGMWIYCLFLFRSLRETRRLMFSNRCHLCLVTLH